jgi:hypothetical protein
MRYVVLCALLVFPTIVHAQATNVQAQWNDYNSVYVTWEYSTGDSAQIFKNNKRYDGNEWIYLDTTIGNYYVKPAMGDVRYTSREGDRYCVQEMKNNQRIGHCVASNPLGERPARSTIILPIVVR